MMNADHAFRGRSRLDAAQEKPVDHRQCRALRLPTQNRQFVPEYDDFQRLNRLGAPAPDGHLQDAANQDITQREQHVASGKRDARLFYASACR